MRSTICISVLSLALALAGGAGADPLLPSGCYARAYDAAHLAAHPAQIVERFTLALTYDAAFDATRAPLSVTLADQGRARAEGAGGQTFEQTLYCYRADGQTTGSIQCGVECDGGSFDVRLDGETLDLRTDYVMVGATGECGGAFDLAEVIGQPVTYRLFRVDDAQCAGLLP